MSDMFKKVIDTARDTARDLADRGRELADKAGEFADQWTDHAHDKVADYNNGSLLGRLATRADELDCDLTITRTKTVDPAVTHMWSVDFGPDTEAVAPDFKTAAENALTVNTVPPAPVAPDPTKSPE